MLGSRLSGSPIDWCVSGDGSLQAAANAIHTVFALGMTRTCAGCTARYVKMVGVQDATPTQYGPKPKLF
jgi:hypothetical protein